MFRKVGVPIMGIIENMSYFRCPKCGHSEHIFGQDGAVRTGEELNMELLGQVKSYLDRNCSLCHCCRDSNILSGLVLSTEAMQQSTIQNFSSYAVLCKFDISLA